MKRKFKNLIKRFAGILRKPEMQVLPGQLAFYFLMSFVPIFALTSLIGSTINENINLSQTLTNNMPAALSSIILPFIETPASSTSFIILLMGYMILGLNGPKSIIRTCNTIYGVKNPGFIKMTIKAIFMIIIIIALLLFMVFIPILGDIIIKFVINLFENPASFYKYSYLYEIIKVVVSFLFIYIAIKLIYTLAPDKKIKSSSTTIGALFTTCCWIIFSEIFSFYITKVARYNALYGNFANILILLLWLYFLAYLFVVGLALNVNFYKESYIVGSEENGEV